MQTIAEIADYLRYAADLYFAKAEAMCDMGAQSRGFAFAKAADAVANIDIGEKLKGIGPVIAEVIHEYQHTGTCARIDQLAEHYDRADMIPKELHWPAMIHGMSFPFMFVLVRRFGFSTVEGLEAALPSIEMYNPIVHKRVVAYLKALKTPPLACPPMSMGCSVSSAPYCPLCAENVKTDCDCKRTDNRSATEIEEDARVCALIDKAVAQGIDSTLEAKPITLEGMKACIEAIEKTIPKDGITFYAISEPVYVGKFPGFGRVTLDDIEVSEPVPTRGHLIKCLESRQDVDIHGVRMLSQSEAAELKSDFEQKHSELAKALLTREGKTEK